MNAQPSKEYQQFRGAIRGWAFCNNAMLRERIKHGKEFLPALSGRELEDAVSTIQSMEGVLVGIPL